MINHEVTAILAVAAASIAVWGSALALLIKHPEQHWKSAGHDKRAWAIIQVVAGFSALGVLTGLAFLIVVWPKLRRAARTEHIDSRDGERNAVAGIPEDGHMTAAAEPGVLVIRIDRRCALDQRVAVEVDGAVVARLRRDEVQRVAVAAGSHEVRARLDWLSSPGATVVMPAEGEVAVVISSHHDLSSLESVLVRPEVALDLSVEPSTAGGAGRAHTAMSAGLIQRPSAQEDLDGPFRRSG